MSSAIRYDLITLDVYSALFDFAGSLRPVVGEALGKDVPAADLIATWRSVQLTLAGASNSLGGPRLPFREATRKGLDHALLKHGVDASAQTRRALVLAWDAIDPWPEAGAMLEMLRERGYTTALLSNGDQDMLEALAKRLAVPPAHVFSSEEAGRYKPHPAMYALPVERLGLDRGRLLHVAGSPMDALGAKHAGLACAWSNRRGDPPLDPDLPPDFTLRDLSGIAAIV